MDITDHELLTAAEAAWEKAYAPYSKFKVGAAILGSDGKIYCGCNVENASYGAAICAERTAAVKAVSEGVTSFEAIAIVASQGDLTYPCGICRQFLSEFAAENFRVLLKDRDGHIHTYNFSELMPFAFEL